MTCITSSKTLQRKLLLGSQTSWQPSVSPYPPSPFLIKTSIHLDLDLDPDPSSQFFLLAHRRRVRICMMPFITYTHMLMMLCHSFILFLRRIYSISGFFPARVLVSFVFVPSSICSVSWPFVCAPAPAPASKAYHTSSYLITFGHLAHVPQRPRDQEEYPNLCYRIIVIRGSPWDYG